LSFDGSRPLGRYIRYITHLIHKEENFQRNEIRQRDRGGGKGKNQARMRGEKLLITLYSYSVISIEFLNKDADSPKWLRSAGPGPGYEIQKAGE